MFRYKADITTKKSLTENQKEPRSTGKLNPSYKGGMDGGKDSWVFSKDGSESENRKVHRHRHHHHHRRRNDSVDLTSSEIDEESLSERDSSTTNENMKVNVSYRGMVYKIKGFKILCSIFAAIILLLVAVAILGVWIIFGANEDGSFYFPWFTKSNDTVKEVVDNSNSKVLSAAETNLASLYPIGLIPETFETISPDLPKDAMETTYSDDSIPAEDTREYETEYYYSYGDGGDYNIADTQVVDSVVHSTAVKPPPGFTNYIPREYDYEEEVLEDHETYQNNDFRVHIGEDVERKPDPIKFSPVDSEFRPSPPVISGFDSHSSDFIGFDNLGKLKSGEKFISDDVDSVNPFNNYDQERREENENFRGYFEVKNNPQVEPKSNNAEKNEESAVIYYDFNEGKAKHQPAVPADQDNFRNDDELSESRLYFESGDPSLHDYDQDQDSETDPHRKLFFNQYDPSQIILSQDSEDEYFNRPESFDRPNLNKEIPKPTLPANYRRNDDFMTQIPHEMNLPPHMRNELLRQRLMVTRNRVPPSEHIGQLPNRRYTGPVRQHPRIPHMQAAPMQRQLPLTENFMRPPNPIMRSGHTSDPRIESRIHRPNRALINKRTLPMQINEPEFTNSQVKRARAQSKNDNDSPGSFFGALQNMYDYSRRLASSLLPFPNQSGSIDDTADSSGLFLKKSFGLLRDYDNVFQSLPRVLTDPLDMIQLPSASQIDQLNPFELSLMTWTFIDFWEFLIEKVGSLSKEDLQVLEARLETIRNQKDASIARSFMSSSDSLSDVFASKFNSTLNMIFNLNENKQTENSTDAPKANNYEEVTEDWNPLNIFDDEERGEFVKYAMKTLFNFGKVYLKSDYAMDCMMLLFCKDINESTKYGGVEGVAAKLKSVGLKVLVDKEGREVDTVTSVWQALVKWEALQCEAMFPKCDGSKALEIVNEVAHASR